MKLKVISSKSEKEIIEACQRGKRSAQKIVYEKYASKMLAISFRYVKNKFEAEGVVLKAFMNVFTKINQFKGEGNFEGWIKRIVINETISFLRKRKKMEILLYENITVDTPCEVVSYNFEEEELLAAIHKLPLGYRTVFNLYAIEGYSHKEIAKTLNISIGTSKSQLNRARKWLQKYLEKLEKKISAQKIY